MMTGAIQAMARCGANVIPADFAERIVGHLLEGLAG